MKKKDDKVGFGLALARAIDESEYNMTTLGELIGVSSNAIKKWVEGRSFPKVDKWTLLKREIGLDPQEYRTYINEGVRMKAGKNARQAAGNYSETRNGVVLTEDQEYLIRLINKMNNKEQFTQDIIFSAMERLRAKNDKDNQ